MRMEILMKKISMVLLVVLLIGGCATFDTGFDQLDPVEKVVATAIITTATGIMAYSIGGMIYYSLTTEPITEEMLEELQ